MILETCQRCIQNLKSMFFVFETFDYVFSLPYRLELGGLPLASLFAGSFNHPFRMTSC